jgi:Chaperone of endosialidase
MRAAIQNASEGWFLVIQRNPITVNAVVQTQPQRKMKTNNKTTAHTNNSINRSPWRRGLPRLQPVWIIRGFLFITLLFACVALSQNAQGVVPPPDGGYPGGNTAEGQNALLSLTTGTFNTAVGFRSLTSDTSGSFNTALGAGTLTLNLTGSNNTAVGQSALFQNNIGHDNTATGVGALRNNTNGSVNVASGVNALQSNLTGSANVAIGVQALFSNTGGSDNTAVGRDALSSNTRGGSNTAIGEEALVENTTGEANTATGAAALRFNTTGGNNTAMGLTALSSNTTGFQNTAVGGSSGNGITEGHGNTAIGFGAGASQTTGSNNVYIGTVGVFGIPGENNTCYIGSIFGQTSPSGVPVVINSNNKLGTATSSKRFKEDIKPMDKASEALFSLKPVAFRYKKEIDLQGIPQFGLVAEDVEKVNPDLVVRDKDGKPYTVRYDAVNAMLLNEFLKEHRKVEEQNGKIQRQEATITELESTVALQQKGLQAVTARLEQQDVQIQKVSAQFEASKFATGRIRGGGPAPRVVNNP